MLPQAVKGLRVLEWATGVAAPYAARLLMEHGAEVIKIESPGQGDWTRRGKPFKESPPAGVREKDRVSGLFFYYNVGKKGITLNPGRERGRELFRALVGQADVLIEDQPPGRMEELGLGYDSLSEINPRLVMLSVTPFGQTGPYRHYKSYPLIDLHSGGEGSGLPVMAGGDFTESFCGMIAAMGVVVALWRRRRTGNGNHVDLSKQEASMWPARVELVAFPNAGIGSRRRDRGAGGAMRTKDGYVQIAAFESKQWDGLVEAMGHPAWALDPRYRRRMERSADLQKINPLIEEWTKQHTAQEVQEALQGHGCPAVEVMPVHKVAESEHYAARGYYAQVEAAGLGQFKLPTTPFLGAKPSYSPAPGLGEHNGEVFAALGLGLEGIDELRQEGVI